MKLFSIATAVLALALTSFASTTSTQSKPSPSTPAVATYTAPDGSFSINKLGDVTVDGPKSEDLDTKKGTLHVAMTIYHTTVNTVRVGVVDVKLDHTATEDDMALVGARFINGINGEVVDGYDLNDHQVIMVLKVPGRDELYGAYFLLSFNGKHVFEVIYTTPVNSDKAVIDAGTDYVNSFVVNDSKLSK